MMKTTHHLLLLIFMLCHSAHALEQHQINRLSLLAKTWSAGKNFHSGSCQINWDQSLLETIDMVVNASDKNAFNHSLNTMLDGLGTNAISNQSIPQTPTEISQPIDYSWTNDDELNAATQNRIKTLITTFRPRNNCHVLNGQVNQGDYSTDNRYAHILTPNKEQRLLAVFRFWNIINMYFPYKNLIDQPWDDVLDTYIPLIYDADDQVEYQRLMRRFTSAIQDSHAFFTSQTFNNSFATAHLPFRIKTAEGQAIIYKKLADQTSMNIGDKVLSINGVSVKTLQQQNFLFNAASNPATLVRNSDYFYNIGEPGTAQLTLVNANNETYNITSNYGAFPVELYQPSTISWTHMDQSKCSIGYVNMGQLETFEIAGMMQAFNNKDAIIFDLRNYPNGTLWTLVNYLYRNPVQVARFAQPDFTYPGAYQWLETNIGQGTSNPYDGRLIILFNEETQSQAEYTVMGLEQHPNAVKIGSQTAAADGNITTVELPGRININCTGLGVYYPDNRPTQRIGIIPDLFVRPTIQGIVEGRDEVLETALNCEHVTNPNWPPAPRPSSGLYWDPNKSGKGMDIAEFADSFTVVPYDFRPDGSPVWYLAVAESDNGVLSTSESGVNEFQYNSDQQSITPLPQNTRMSFDFKQGPFEIDCAVAAPENKKHFSRLVWDNDSSQETRCMEAFIFSSQESPANNFTGLWYGGEQENGWGLSINTQGDQLVAVIYYYDQQGRATWILGNTTFNTTQPMAIEMHQFSGYCQGCETTALTSTVAGQLVLSLSRPSNQFETDNWLSLNTQSQQWNRERMPIKMLSKLQ